MVFIRALKGRLGYDAASLRTPDLAEPGFSPRIKLTDSGSFCEPHGCHVAPHRLSRAVNANGKSSPVSRSINVKWRAPENAPGMHANSHFPSPDQLLRPSLPSPPTSTGVPIGPRTKSPPPRTTLKTPAPN